VVLDVVVGPAHEAARDVLPAVAVDPVAGEQLLLLGRRPGQLAHRRTQVVVPPFPALLPRPPHHSHPLPQQHRDLRPVLQTPLRHQLRNRTVLLSQPGLTYALQDTRLIQIVITNIIRIQTKR
jgi:hypothetical protein